jgi:hypothetical protein
MEFDFQQIRKTSIIIFIIIIMGFGLVGLSWVELGWVRVGHGGHFPAS